MYLISLKVILSRGIISYASIMLTLIILNIIR
jgi:hypothetical protein